MILRSEVDRAESEHQCFGFSVGLGATPSVSGNYAESTSERVRVNDGAAAIVGQNGTSVSVENGRLTLIGSQIYDVTGQLNVSLLEPAILVPIAEVDRCNSTSVGVSLGGETFPISGQYARSGHSQHGEFLPGLGQDPDTARKEGKRKSWNHAANIILPNVQKVQEGCALIGNKLQEAFAPAAPVGPRFDFSQHDVAGYPAHVQDAISELILKHGVTPEQAKNVLENTDIQQIFRDTEENSWQFLDIYFTTPRRDRAEQEAEQTGDRVKKALILCGKAARAVGELAEEQPNLTAFVLETTKLALSGPTSYMTSCVMEATGVQERIDVCMEAAETWISGYLQEQLSLTASSADLLTSAGSFGLCFGLSMTGATNTGVILDKAKTVLRKARASAQAVEKKALRGAKNAHKIEGNSSRAPKVSGGKTGAKAGEKGAGKIVETAPRGLTGNVNSKIALNKKLSALENAQKNAYKTKTLSDGRIRYYEKERLAKTPGQTRGSSYVVEHNPKTGQVRSWNECYDQVGKVNRTRPKMIDGNSAHSLHYPRTKKELEQLSQIKRK